MEKTTLADIPQAFIEMLGGVIFCGLKQQPHRTLRTCEVARCIKQMGRNAAATHGGLHEQIVEDELVRGPD